MSKKAAYYDIAENLYVTQNKTLNEITQDIPVAESTLRNWKRQGNWAKKRENYLSQKKAFHEELYEFSRSIMRSIKMDLEQGKKVDSARYYALGRMLPLITKVKDYEDSLRQMGKDEEPEDVKEMLKQVLAEVIGG